MNSAPHKRGQPPATIFSQKIFDIFESYFQQMEEIGMSKKDMIEYLNGHNDIERDRDQIKDGLDNLKKRGKIYEVGDEIRLTVPPSNINKETNDKQSEVA